MNDMLTNKSNSDSQSSETTSKNILEEICARTRAEVTKRASIKPLKEIMEEAKAKKHLLEVLAKQLRKKQRQKKLV